MQTHYFDIKAIPQAELIQSAVMAYIVQVLHRYLPTYNNASDNPIALSFPAYGQGGTVGGIVRVISAEGILSDLQAKLSDLADYALVGKIDRIPEGVQRFAVFSRVHFKGKSHIKHLKRRAVSRGEVWTDDHEKAVIEKFSQRKHMPFLVLKSHSTNQSKMWLHINRELVSHPSIGRVSSYGLNQRSQDSKMTVPWF